MCHLLHTPRGVKTSMQGFSKKTPTCSMARSDLPKDSRSSFHRYSLKNQQQCLEPVGDASVDTAAVTRQERGHLRIARSADHKSTGVNTIR